MDLKSGKVPGFEKMATATCAAVFVAGKNEPKLERKLISHQKEEMDKYNSGDIWNENEAKSFHFMD